jgi:hypothetical protein
LIIEVAPSETEGLANLSNRVVRPQHLNDLALFRRSQLNHVEAFFWMSSATVNRPTSCSRWVIRSETASVDCLSVEANTESAFSRNCCFHFESWSSLRLWHRHSSAWELSPLSASRTTSDLKLGGEGSSFSFRHRRLLSVRLLFYHNLGLDSGPNFRWQYNRFKAFNFIEFVAV